MDENSCILHFDVALKLPKTKIYLDSLLAT